VEIDVLPGDQGNILECCCAFEMSPILSLYVSRFERIVAL
jgi:hypothetical protein